MSRDSLKQALLSSLLGALGVADTKSTPHMQILEEGPPLAGRGGIPEGPVHLIQYGTDNYHCTVVVSTSHGLPPAVLAKLFRENFQHGLERHEKSFLAKQSAELAIDLMELKFSVVDWANWQL
jgi:hypothetical protein